LRLSASFRLLGRLGLLGGTGLVGAQQGRRLLQRRLPAVLAVVALDDHVPQQGQRASRSGLELCPLHRQSWLVRLGLALLNDNKALAFLVLGVLNANDVLVHQRAVLVRVSVRQVERLRAEGLLDVALTQNERARLALDEPLQLGGTVSHGDDSFVSLGGRREERERCDRKKRLEQHCHLVFIRILKHTTLLRP